MWVVKDENLTHVFLGDSIANGCHQFFRDLNLFDWINLQDRLLKEFDESARFYMGHGMPGLTIDAIEWQKGYLNTFLNFLKDSKGSKVDDTLINNALAEMKRYLPTNATEFLLTYELGITLEKMLEKL